MELKVYGKMYADVYLGLDNTAKTVLGAILPVVDDDNLVQIGGRTLQFVLETTGYEENTVRKQLVKLNKSGILEKTNLRGEYILNPAFAVAGDEDEAWKMYGIVEMVLRDKSIML